MVTKKTGKRAIPKLKVRKETIQDLDVSGKTGNVRGGRGLGPKALTGIGKRTLTGLGCVCNP